MLLGSMPVSSILAQNQIERIKKGRVDNGKTKTKQNDIY